MTEAPALCAPRISFDIPTQNRLAIFTLTRLLLMTVVLLTTVFLRQEVLGTGAIIQIYATLGFSFLSSFLSVAFWEQTMRVRYFIPSQLLYDLLLTSYLVYLTGVNDSIFLFLYLINILAASAVYQMNGAILTMAASGTVFAFIYYANIDMDGVSAWYNLLWNQLLFLLTALLCGQFMDEIKKQRTLLDVQRASIARLELLNDRLLNSIPAGIVLVDKDEYVLNVNESALRLLGLRRAPEMRIKYYELLPELRGILDIWPSLTETQRLRHNFRHGSRPQDPTFSLQVVELQASESAPSQRLMLFQDISKMLELEHKLQFESRLSATGELAAGIAHEIRNPLASISGSIDMLAEHLPEIAESDRRLFNIAQREVKRLNSLITDFLEFAKPGDHTSSVVPLAEVAQEVADAMASRPNGHLFCVEQNIAPDLCAHANRERIKQVLFNLYLNALEAAGSAPLMVRLEAAPGPGEILVIDVIDNGPGIPEAVRAKIFTPFFTTKPEGTGLGLSTVAQILRAAKGGIELRPSASGTHFRITIPAAASALIRPA